MIDVLANLVPSITDWLAPAFIILFALFMGFALLRARLGKHYPLRPIRAHERLATTLARAAEGGQPVHLALGVGELKRNVAEMSAGLTTLDYALQKVRPRDQRLLVSTGNPILYAAAAGKTIGKHSSTIDTRFAGPAPLAYAAGAHIYAQEINPITNVLLGYFEQEGLWLAEAERGKGALQLGGTSQPEPSALLSASLDESAIGEDLFTVGAFLHDPRHSPCIVIQDWARTLIIWALIIGVALCSLGYWR